MKPYDDGGGVLFNEDGTKLLRFPAENGMREYVVPDIVESIGEYAFAGCELETLDLNQVRRAGRGAVSDCLHLRELRLGSRLEVISEMMVHTCFGIRELVIPPSVTAIENYGIWRCGNLKEVIIPRTVKRISPYPFGFKRGKVVHLEANGAALYIREEFPATGDPENPVDFRKYDGRFSRGDEETKMMVAYYRLAYPVELPERYALEYRGFLRRCVYEVADRLIREDDAAGIRFLAEKGIIFKDNIDELIRRAGEAGRVSITASLLQYKNQNLSNSDDLFEL